MGIISAIVDTLTMFVAAGVKGSSLVLAELAILVMLRQPKN